MVICNRHIIEMAEGRFLKEDREEPFANRDYVKESKRIYRLLKKGVGI